MSGRTSDLFVGCNGSRAAQERVQHAHLSDQYPSTIFHQWNDAHNQWTGTTHCWQCTLGSGCSRSTQPTNCKFGSSFICRCSLVLLRDDFQPMPPNNQAQSIPITVAQMVSMPVNATLSANSPSEALNMKRPRRRMKVSQTSTPPQNQQTTYQQPQMPSPNAFLVTSQMGGQIMMPTVSFYGYQSFLFCFEKSIILQTRAQQIFMTAQANQPDYNNTLRYQASNLTQQTRPPTMVTNNHQPVYCMPAAGLQNFSPYQQQVFTMAMGALPPQSGMNARPVTAATTQQQMANGQLFRQRWIKKTN